MVQLLFARLPQFKDDTNSSKQVKDLTTKNHQRIQEQTNTTDETPETIFPEESELIDHAKVESTPSQMILPIVIPSSTNPMDIGMSAVSSTNEPVKGTKGLTSISKEISYCFDRIINSIWMALCSWSLSFSH